MQCKLFIKLLGLPPKHIQDKILDASVIEYMKKEAKSKPLIEKVLHRADPLLIDLIKKLLRFDPASRLSAEEAQKHPFFRGMESFTKNKVRDMPTFDFEFEKYDASRSVLKEMLMDEICLYHSKEAKEHYKKLRDENPKGYL